MRGRKPKHDNRILRYLTKNGPTTQAALAKGDKVQLVGFGTFEVRERAARQGRNPQDPEKVIEIPAKNAPVFRPGKGLKEAVEVKKGRGKKVAATDVKKVRAKKAAPAK